MRVTRSFLTWAQVAGLLATAYYTWVHSLGPRLGRDSLLRLLSSTLTYALIAWACAAMITLAILITVSPADMRHLLRAATRTSAVAVWFAPAIILLSAGTAGTFTASLILVVNTTRLLIARWIPPDAAGKHLGHVLLKAFGGAIVLQAGLVAVLWGYPLLSAALVGGSAAIVTALSLLTGAYRTTAEPRLPLAFLSILLTFVLAVALLPGGGGAPTGVPGSSDVRGRPAPKLVAPPPPAPAARAARKQDVPAHASVYSSEIGGGDFPGVVLLPELTPETRLVAPPSATPEPPVKSIAQPLSFPFSGEYWMFRPPAARPPQRSFFRRGSPLRQTYRTTDGKPLQMEASQLLARPVDPLCCLKLQLLIASGDRYPGTVSLEVILRDTEGRGSQSLGRAATGPAARDLLDFWIPASPALHQFNQIRVIFHRDPVRVDHSARMGIERFILVPKARVSPLREQLVATRGPAEMSSF